MPKLEVKRAEGMVVVEVNWKPSMSPTATPRGAPEEGAMSARGTVSSRPASVKAQVTAAALMLVLAYSPKPVPKRAWLELKGSMATASSQWGVRLTHGAEELLNVVLEAQREVQWAPESVLR